MMWQLFISIPWKGCSDLLIETLQDAILRLIQKTDTNQTCAFCPLKMMTNQCNNHSPKSVLQKICSQKLCQIYKKETHPEWSLAFLMVKFGFFELCCSLRKINIFAISKDLIYFCE